MLWYKIPSRAVPVCLKKYFMYSIKYYIYLQKHQWGTTDCLHPSELLDTNTISIVFICICCVLPVNLFRKNWKIDFWNLRKYHVLAIFLMENEPRLILHKGYSKCMGTGRIGKLAGKISQRETTRNSRGYHLALVFALLATRRRLTSGVGVANFTIYRSIDWSAI